ncbi:MAG: hypothetical protein FJX80_07030 [Bacteroidetes bacterium]|nr:hypothetical protein [Bacteroidota bacterium]
MKKEYSRNKMVVVSFTQNEFEHLQSFIKLSGFDQSILMSKSAHYFFYNICRNDDIEDFN